MAARRIVAAWALLGSLLLAGGCGDPIEPPAATTAAPCGADIAVSSERAVTLTQFAEDLNLEHPRAFAAVVATLVETSDLPACYLSKAEARAAGWRPGGDLWEQRPGFAIGGDAFRNFEGHLPPGQTYAAADLDYTGGRRGPRRLVYVTDAGAAPAMWVTVDHYNTFTEVPSVP